MDIEDRTEQPLYFNSFKEIVDNFFINQPNKNIEAELWKWFVFAVSSKGLTISDLSECDFELFSARLTELLAAIFNWSNSHKISPATRETAL